MAEAVLERESLIPYFPFMIMIATNKIINKPPQSNHTMFTLLQLSKHCPCMKWGHKITSDMTLFLAREGKVKMAVTQQLSDFRNTTTEQPLRHLIRVIMRHDLANKNTFTKTFTLR